MDLKANSFIAGLAVSRKLGFEDFTILTHAWEESNGFKRVIGNYNCWGIKVPKKSPWPGPVVSTMTTEYTKMLPGETPDTALLRLIKLWGRSDLHILGSLKGMWKIGLPQQFIDFTSQDAAIKWYCDFIKRLYPLAFDNRREPVAYFNGLVGKGKKVIAGQGNPMIMYESVEGSLVYATDPEYVSNLVGVQISLERNNDVLTALRDIK